MQACTIQFAHRLYTCANFRALACFFALALLSLAPQQNTFADSGVINRAPIVKPIKKATNLDKLADSLGDIVKSIDQIVADPNDDETQEQLIAEPVEHKASPIEVIAKPKPIVDKPIINSVPAAPALASPEPLEPAPVKEPVKTTVKIEVEEIPVLQKAATTPVTTVQKTSFTPTFLKLSTRGDKLKENAEQWACVEDTRNGLIWEVKGNDGGLRDKKHSYSWFDPSNENLKGIADGGRCKGGIECDTNAYVQALNEQNFCGHSDWRLPTREEIQQLVKLDNDGAEATINQKLFPETEPSWYWTSSSNQNNPDYAWYVLFRNGISLNDLKERAKHIRLVRTDKKV